MQIYYKLTNSKVKVKIK